MRPAHIFCALALATQFFPRPPHTLSGPSFGPINHHNSPSTGLALHTVLEQPASFFLVLAFPPAVEPPERSEHTFSHYAPSHVTPPACVTHDLHSPPAPPPFSLHQPPQNPCIGLSRPALLMDIPVPALPRWKSETGSAEMEINPKSTRLSAPPPFRPPMRAAPAISPRLAPE